jgi:hypothetical protein
MLARALHESGVYMGEQFSPGISYLKAKYEAKWVQSVNDKILHSGRNVLSLQVTSRLLPETGPCSKTREMMESRIKELQNRYPKWGFKDPRMALTYQFWKKSLPEHRLVIIYRNPIEVWKRYSGFIKPWQYRLPFETWCDYNSMILRYIKESSSNQYVCLNFEKLLTGNDEWNRFSSYVGSDLVDIRDVSQAKNRCSEDDYHSLSYRLHSFAAGRKVQRIYHALEKVRSDQLLE